LKGIKSGQEFGPTPPVGRYRCRLEAVTATFANSSGNPVLKITGEILAPQEFARRQFYDTIITDGSIAGTHVRKLRQLLGPRADTDEEIPDNVLASELTGLELDVDLNHQPRMDRGPTGKWDVPVTQLLADGKRISVMNLKADAYYRLSIGTQVPAQAPAQAAAPTQAPYPPQHPHPFSQVLPPPPGGGQPQPQVPQAWQPPPGWPTPPGWGPPPQQPQQFATPPWQPPPAPAAPPNGADQPATGKRVRKTEIKDVPEAGK